MQANNQPHCLYKILHLLCTIFGRASDILTRERHAANSDSVQTPDKAAAQRRFLQQQLNDPVLLAFGPVPSANEATISNAVNGRFTVLEDSDASLPDNVHLLTTKVLEDGDILLRVAHLFQVKDYPGPKDNLILYMQVILCNRKAPHSQLMQLSLIATLRVRKV